MTGHELIVERATDAFNCRVSIAEDWFRNSAVRALGDLTPAQYIVEDGVEVDSKVQYVLTILSRMEHGIYS